MLKRWDEVRVRVYFDIPHGMRTVEDARMHNL